MIALKVFAVRAGIIGLIALGFGGVAAVVSQSILIAAASATFGGVLALRRALRITRDDVDF